MPYIALPLIYLTLMDKNRLIGHLSSGTAYAIFGLNVVFCKDIANAAVISPEALLSIRLIFATSILWLVSFFFKNEKVPIKDLLLMALAAIAGVVLPQYTFLKGITMAGAIDTSIFSSLTPIWTMLFAAIFVKEPITGKKVLGVVTSFAGVLLLILTSLHFSGGVGHTKPMGIALLLLNGISFAAYLGIFRPLIQRYKVLTLTKWMFLFSAICCLPTSIKPMLMVDYSAISPMQYFEIGYLVVFATVIAYFLIPIGQQRLRPTVVSMYTYLQPIIAVVASIISGLDILTWQKVVAIALVFTGVYIVNRSRAAATTAGA